jgi:hypothetical protein
VEPVEPGPVDGVDPLPREVDESLPEPRMLSELPKPEPVEP